MWQWYSTCHLNYLQWLHWCNTDNRAESAEAVTERRRKLTCVSSSPTVHPPHPPPSSPPHSHSWSVFCCVPPTSCFTSHWHTILHMQPLQTWFPSKSSLRGREGEEVRISHQISDIFFFSCAAFTTCFLWTNQIFSAPLCLCLRGFSQFLQLHTLHSAPLFVLLTPYTPSIHPSTLPAVIAFLHSHLSSLCTHTHTQLRQQLCVCVCTVNTVHELHQTAVRHRSGLVVKQLPSPTIVFSCGSHGYSTETVNWM